MKAWRAVTGIVPLLTALLLIVGTAAAEPRVPTILAFGDSFTAGLGLTRDAAFPARLEAWLAAQQVPANVINAGVSGETTAAGLARLDAALAAHPDIVILELGANDALRGINPALTRRNLDLMIEKIRAGGARLLLTGMLAPTNWGDEYRQAFDRVYPELASLRQVPLYPFFLEGVAQNPHLNQPDTLHPNERGVAIIVSRIGPVVQRLFFTDTATPRP
jgi:acyl-CoA thioesterase-1